MKIEFRGKDIKTGEWRYGNIIYSLDAVEGFDAIIIPKNNNNMFARPDEKSDLGFEVWHKVDPKTVGQYTNVNTHRGEKIFQGDVVTVKHTEIAYKKHTPFGVKVGYAPDEDFIGVVEFLEGMWVVNNRVDKMILLWSETNESEILGNIHDNPELLEVPE
ncbi:hypothetical protein AAU59_14045 [Listeria monocytogenes]|nr:hypothetical protein [Listeria monocytogenes]